MLKRLLSALAAFSIIAAPVSTWATEDYTVHRHGSALSEPRIELAQLLLGVTNTTSGALYAASAVHFMTNTNFNVQGSAVTGLGSGPKGTISFWYRCSLGASGFTVMNNCNVFAPIANLAGATQTAESVSGVVVVIDNAGSIYGTMRLNRGDASSGASATSAHNCNTIIAASQPANVWTHWLMSWDITSANHVAMYKNGVSVATDCNSTGYSGAYPLTVPYNSAAGFGLFSTNWTGTNKINSGSTGVGEIADIQMDFTTSALNPGTSVISAGNIAKFYSAGLPVNPGALCANSFGSQPQFCFVGDKSTFLTNAGSIGAGGMTLNGGDGRNKIYNSTTSPSAPTPAHTVYNKWTVGQQTQVGGGLTTFTTNTGSNSIVLGDFLVLIYALEDTNRSTTSSAGHAMSCPDGTWTPQYNNFNNGGSTNSSAVDEVVCTKFAAAGDVGNTGYTFTWTTAPSAGANFVLMAFGGVDGTTPGQRLQRIVQRDELHGVRQCRHPLTHADLRERFVAWDFFSDPGRWCDPAHHPIDNHGSPLHDQHLVARHHYQLQAA
jgi:hypothetical protein